jgi:2-oxoglutarate ferredoxin oxidoreductase subunit beta
MDKATLASLQQNAHLHEDLETHERITWCSGCGNYSILNALKRALALEELSKEDVLFCFDIGCHGNGSDKINGYTIHGLHGRVLPLASGAALARPDKKIIAAGGDGATFSEGINHLIHTIRNNYPLVFLHHNNYNYALTTGQASSITCKAWKRVGTPGEVAVDPLEPLEFVLNQKPAFLARSSSVDTDHLTQTIRQALQVDGFAFIDILQLCPTYNRETDRRFYLENIEEISAKSLYDPTDFEAARQQAARKDKLPVGIIYQNPEKKSFFDTLIYKNQPRADLTKKVEPVGIEKFYEL